MLLKRIYDHSGDTPVLDHIKAIRTSKVQKFTQKFIDKSVFEGFATLSKGKIILHAKPKDLTYKIVRVPGMYCCFDNAPMENQKSARKYVKDYYADTESPDSNNPSGYRKDAFYACELVEK